MGLRTVLTGTDVAFEQGYQAYQNGNNINTNPYPFGSKESDAWRNGWLRGEECKGQCDG